ncbi:hypothetical protein EVAR_78235_1 [Eumeta japonica]|uniref:Uncharacterized protein n=1 Tax=Eumeta variegata TaxID=151549 RepID=A0A4C1T6E5_EUMVA|nr:hypothetical protein EVAR_78235_1 [Eumeta japonica]
MLIAIPCSILMPVLLSTPICLTLDSNLVSLLLLKPVPIQGTAYAAKYTGEFNVQLDLDNLERSWSTIQGVVPRNEIARSCTPGVEQRLGSSRSLPATRDIYTRVDLSYTDRRDLCPARLTVIVQVWAVSKLSAEDSLRRNGHWRSKLYAEIIHSDLAHTTCYMCKQINKGGSRADDAAVFVAGTAVSRPVISA